MITIVKDGRKILCSKNTYKSMYERLGYNILENKKEAKEIKEENKVQDNTAREETIINKRIKNNSKSKKGE